MAKELEFTILLEDSSIAGGKKDENPRKAPPRKQAAPATVAPHSPSSRSVSSMDEMFSLAREWVGSPYLSPSLVMSLGEEKAQQIISKRSHSDKRAIDCSGFAQEVLGYAGVDPPGDQTAEGLYSYFKTHGTVVKTPQKGALIFFEPIKKAEAGSGTWDAGRSITHVALSTGGGNIIDSSGGRGVTERALPPEGRFKYHYVMPKYRWGG